MTEVIRNTLDNKRLGYGISIDLQRLLIKLIIEFGYQNWNIMVFVDVPLRGLLPLDCFHRVISIQKIVKAGACYLF